MSRLTTEQEAIARAIGLTREQFRGSSSACQGARVALQEAASKIADVVIGCPACYTGKAREIWLTGARETFLELTIHPGG